MDRAIDSSSQYLCISLEIQENFQSEPLTRSRFKSDTSGGKTNFTAYLIYSEIHIGSGCNFISRTAVFWVARPCSLVSGLEEHVA
jgi:hypothetical protein